MKCDLPNISWFLIRSLSPGPALSLQLSPELVLILSLCAPAWPPWYEGEVRCVILCVLSIRPGG